MSILEHADHKKAGRAVVIVSSMYRALICHVRSTWLEG